MKMPSNLSGRIRNTSLPLTSGLLPLYEAVVNSIHGIEESGLKTEDGRIDIEILRKPKQGLLALNDIKKKPGPDAQDDIIGFKVSDNGVGFTDANMQSFEELDTEHKVAKGCRGVGRLLWLKAFQNVRIESVYRENAKLKKRTFAFTISKGVDKKTVTDSADTNTVTTVHLDGFIARYRANSKKTIKAISEAILDHCLWYYVRDGGCPVITIYDDGETIELDNLYEEKMHASASSESISINNIDFELTHIKFRSNSRQGHCIAFCADNRLVTEESISGKIPGLYGRINDANGGFYYSCYISSPFLDQYARPERTGFDIAELPDALTEKTEVSFSQIKNAVIEKTSKHLGNYLTENIEAAKKKIDNFVSNKAPKYRPILARIPKEKLTISPDANDKDIDIALHKYLSEMERELLSEGHEIMTPAENEKPDEYRKRLQDYISKAEDIKKSDLASYVFHRKVILDLFSMAIKRNSDGKYSREDIIHELIIPMQKTSDEIATDGCNLWLIDERLAFHEYLASDKTINSMPITNSESTKEPDICALNVYDNPLLVSEGEKMPLATITVVELKRPMRDDAKPGEIDDPIEQAIGYVDRIRKGQVQTVSGRPIPNSENIPGFCYVIADLTDTKFEQRCRIHHDLKPTHDKMGFFGYKENVNTYVEVISFERLINAAYERNKAFFDKLGLPTN